MTIVSQTCSFLRLTWASTLPFFALAGAATAQEVTTDAENDLLNLANGAVVLSQSSQSSAAWAALLLLDDSADRGWSTFRGEDFPHEVVIELAAPARLHAITIDNSSAPESSYPGISARGIQIWTSRDGPSGPFESALEAEVPQGARATFSLPAGPVAQWLRLEVHSNWGDALYTAIMELEAAGQSEEPLTLRDVSGSYSTNYGPLRLEQTGTLIRGCYDQNGGTFSGSVAGSTLHLEWRQNSGLRSGTALLVLSSAGDALNGIWYETGAYGGFWVGTPAGSGQEPSCRIDSGSAIAHALEESDRAVVYGIRFDVDSDQIRAASEPALAEILSVLRASESLRLMVEGHTDSMGEAGYNENLSQRRAAAVVGWLVERGIAPTRLASEGLGESRPVASNESAQGRALNRRVELRRLP